MPCPLTVSGRISLPAEADTNCMGCIIPLPGNLPGQCPIFPNALTPVSLVHVKAAVRRGFPSETICIWDRTRTRAPFLCIEFWNGSGARTGEGDELDYKIMSGKTEPRPPTTSPWQSAYFSYRNSSEALPKIPVRSPKWRNVCSPDGSMNLIRIEGSSTVSASGRRSDRTARGKQAGIHTQRNVLFPSVRHVRDVASARNYPADYVDAYPEIRPTLQVNFRKYLVFRCGRTKVRRHIVG